MNPQDQQEDEPQRPDTQSLATEAQPHQPDRPRGPSTGTVALGLVCLAVAALVITYQLHRFAWDWQLAGPAVVIGTGILLVLIGLLGLVRRRPRQPDEPDRARQARPGSTA